MLKSVRVGAISAGPFLVVFVLLLASFSHDPQTPIGLMFSPVYAAFVGLLIGVIHASVGTIRTSKSRVGAFVALPIATVLLLGFACWIVAEAFQNFGH
jgi:hypothetical protein